MSKNDFRYYKCVKPINGFIVGKIYPCDIFGWVDNRYGIISYDMDCFEQVNSNLVHYEGEEYTIKS